VKRLMNGFVAITAEQNVRQFLSGTVVICSFMHILSHPLSRSGRVVLHRGTAHIFRSIPSPTRAGRFSEPAGAHVVLIQQSRY
jgi:hypothetical protein